MTSASVVKGRAGAPYEPGLLFLREGALLEKAVRELREPPDVLVVNGTRRDHPRRAGLAVHLGALLNLPTTGVTHRPLCARGAWPDDATGEKSPLVLGEELVGYWLRTRSGARPLAVHAGWRTTARTAVDVVTGVMGPGRTPQPLRLARQAQRLPEPKGEVDSQAGVGERASTRA